MDILIFIVILVGLVLIHELGHLVMAKLFGIRVDQFNIGFPPRLFKIQKGETLYSFNLILIGGYVQIYGENPEDLPAQAGGAGDPRAFSSRSRSTQAAVIVAGVLVNGLAAWLLLSAGYMAGLPTAVDHQGIGTVTDAHAMVVGVLPGSPGEQAGLAEGDVIEAVQTGTAQLAAGADASDVRTFIGVHPDESLVFTVLRDNQEKTFLAKAAAGLVPDRKVVGIDLDDVGTLKLSPPLALWQGALLAKNIFVQTAEGLGSFALSLVHGSANLNQVAGPIGIVTIGGTAVQAGWSQLIVLVASISMALALFNLIPIPGLDGGRLFILIIEGVFRRQVPQKLVLALTLAGMALLIILMLVVSYHDITKLVG